MKPTIIIVYLILLATSAQAEVYQWVDKNGVVTFSNHPSSSKANVVSTHGAMQGASGFAPSQHPPYIRPSQVESSDAQTEALRQSLDDQIAQLQQQLAQARLLSAKKVFLDELNKLYRTRAELR